eukprot:jgi/Botrbrau1/3846/Bobra.0183s0071.1
MNGTWDPSTRNTVGAAFCAKRVTTSTGRVITMGIWDTAGAERYHSLGTLYHNGARAAIVCFDASNRRSWEKLKDWVKELTELRPNCHIYITATKVDLLEDAVGSSELNGSATSPPSLGEESPLGDDGENTALGLPHPAITGQLLYRQVTEGEVTSYVRSLGARLFQTSAKTGLGVLELFQEIANDAAVDLANEAPPEGAPPAANPVLQIIPPPAHSAQPSRVRATTPCC